MIPTSIAIKNDYTIFEFNIIILVVKFKTNLIQRSQRGKEQRKAKTSWVELRS